MPSTAAAASSSTDRLSHLSDDILTHILSFAPSPEAARATALSRRWRRPLWLHTGAVQIDHRSYNNSSGGVVMVDRRRVVDDADHAYACLCSHGGRAPRKLSIVMPDDAILCTAFDEQNSEDDSVQEEEEGDGVDDLRLEWLNNGGLPRCTLPFAVLRVLELTGYDLKPYANQRRRNLSFPRLEAMRLRRCRTELQTLQDMITAAPMLADIHLDGLNFLNHRFVYCLSCESATVIVIENCGRLYDKFNHIRMGCKLELDAPQLRQFRYTQTAFLDEHTFFSFEWPPPHLEQIHIAVHSGSRFAGYLYDRILTNAGQYLRHLKLTVYSIADLANDFWEDFPSLGCLEIQELCGWSIQNHRQSARAMLNLLRKCPVVEDLRLKFSWKKYLREISSDPDEEMAAIADFSPCGSLADEDQGECCESLEYIHEEFCSRSKLGCLRRVVVEFDAEELTCFQVRLIKFLAKSTGTLEEFIVNGGKGYDSSPIDRKVARWRKPRRQPRLLPLTPPCPLRPPPLSEFPPLEPSPCASPNQEIGDDDDVPEVKEYIYNKSYVHSSEEEQDDDDDDISPRHYIHTGRKKKKGGSPECFSVKSKELFNSKELFMSRMRRARPPRQQHSRRRWKEQSADVSSVLAALPLPAAVSVTEATVERWSAPLMYEFPLLRRAPPPAPLEPPIRRSPLAAPPICRSPPAAAPICRSPPAAAPICRSPPAAAPICRSPPAAEPRPSSPPESIQVNIATSLALLYSTDDTFARGGRAVRQADLGINVVTASRQGNHHLPPRRRFPLAASHRRFATFSGRPS